MGLFLRRPLALFTFIFLVSGLMAYGISNNERYVGMIGALVIIILLVVLSFIIKRYKMNLLVASICISAVIFSLLQSLIFIGIPTRNAYKYEGDNTVLCYVIDETDDGEHSKKYDVKIKRIGDEAVDIRAQLICGFDVDLNGGDEIYGASGLVAETGDSPNQLLVVYMDSASDCYVRYSSEGKGFFTILFSECGIEILSGRLGDLIQDKLFELLGETKGALAMGFFTGKRSEIPSDIVRNFRRTGVSHIMAVSGSHISILLGCIEFILRRLLVHKNIRCIVVTVFSIGFLFVTGFSLSACRSVFMLYAVYIAYFIREKGDNITSLFISVTVIVLIFPFSIVDLGLWMSFLATLGLLTVFPVIEEKIPYPRKKPKSILVLLKVGREALLIIIMTVVANMFLLPVIWYYFKEFSLVAILTNLLISSLSSVFLLTVPFLLFVSGIPILGVIARHLVSFIADAILFIVRICSRIPNATVSLKYEFCAYIVILFAIALSVLLLIRLKHKLFVFLPYGVSVAAFAICFTVYGVWISSPSVEYVKYDRNELLIFYDNSELSVCDNSEDSFYTYQQIRHLVQSSYATDIDNYIFTAHSEDNVRLLSLLSKEYIIQSVYLPTPKNEVDNTYSNALRRLAEESGIAVKFYGNGGSVDAVGDTNIQLICAENGAECLNIYNGYRRITYATPEYCGEDVKCDILIVGESEGWQGRFDISGVCADRIYVTTSELAKRLVLPSGGNKYVPNQQDKYYKISFSLK